MKKILMLVSILLFILLFPFKSYAAYTAPNDDDYESYFQVSRSSNASTWNIWINSPRIGLSKEHMVGTDYNVFGLENGNLKQLYYYYHSLTNNSNDYTYGYAEKIVGSGNGSIATYPQENCPLFDTDEELLYYLQNGAIDWDTIYYNPQIPVPKLGVWYLYQVESFRQEDVANFTANIDVPDNTDFYIELAYKYSYPTSIRVYPSDLKGTPAYDYGYYQSSDLISIYTLQDQKQSINVHVKGEDLQEEWQDAYDEFRDTVAFYTPTTDTPPSWLNNAASSYKKYMMTQLPMYGNRLEVFARYWTLSEENQVVVGKWYHWQSAKGSATEDVPDNYVNYQPLPGYSGTVENVPTSNENTYDGVGTETGLPNTTVIQYAPNYPDYPTVASYNKDNLLVSSIEKLNEVKIFFGEFNDFLSVSFVWIPSWIWAIIGVGFALSIIVFFLRML